MKRAVLTAAVASCAELAATSANALVLADRGKTDFRIVIGRDASPSEKHGAAELQGFLREISGVALPIADDSAPMGEHEILLGDSDHLRALQQGIDWKSLGHEGFVMRTSGGHLILAGGRLRGSMYAVYTFLEDLLGCRWFTATVSKIPKTRRIEVGPLDVTHVPVLEYRDSDWAEARDGDWAARNRMNGTAARLDEACGGKITYAGFVHTFYALLPLEQYFKDHPEYYSEISGGRIANGGQLCLTNPEVVRLVGERAKQWLRENPQAQIVSVSQNDGGGWCECANCKALDEREGSHAGTMLSFVNQVAEIVEREFPHVAVDTLAYYYTRTPPKTIRPRANVIVRLCSLECCFSHPLATCPENKTFKDDLGGWAKVAKRLYVWDYTTNFAHYLQPHPNLRVLKPNIQFYEKNNVRGIFEEGNYSAQGGELGDLRSYMLAKLLWDPNYDERKAMCEFLEGVYGKAAPAIERYLGLMHDKVQSDNIHCNIWCPPTSPYLSPAMIESAGKTFDEAERLADNAEIRERVRLARLPIQYVELERVRPEYRVVGGVYKIPEVRQRSELAERFFEVAKRHGIAQVSEGIPLSSYEERIRGATPAWPAVRLENRSMRVDVVPALGGRLVAIYDKRTRTNVLLPPQGDDAYYPRSAGYEEYSRSLYRSPGWREEYEHRVEVPARRVVMWANLENGLKVERTVEVGERDPVVSVTSRLVNVSNEERIACIRTHPMFHLGPTDDVVVSLRTVAGGKRTVALRQRAQRMNPEVLLKGDQRPAGIWQGVNEKTGLGVRQTFDVAQVEQCLLNWRLDRERFNLELISPEKRLAPGESMELTHGLQLVSTKSARP